MSYVHRSYLPGETIAAIATAPGEGGIAVIRISGKEALAVAHTCFSGNVPAFASHTAHLGKILGEEGHVIDEVLLLPMHGPRSYTGEDTVEIHCHGGSLIARRVLERVLKAGARAASPGEFTFRAFINGKLDLAQAEAVQQLIAAKSDLALSAAEKQLEGQLSRTVLSFQKALLDIAAILEAWVDFPEEGIEFRSLEEVGSELESLCQDMQRLADTFDQGRLLHEGFSLCIVGPPNAGKSSLMNALLGKERAIVTDIPGTTRDLLEEDVRFGRLPFRIIDTAGIRDTSETIEKEGIRRSKQAMQEADFVLLVLDGARGMQEEERVLLEATPKEKRLLVWNKVDLPHHSPPQGAIAISAKEGKGLDELRSALDRLVWKKGPPSKEEIFITSARHHTALKQAISACQLVVKGLKSNVSPEFLASDLRAALSELGTIIGLDITEDILSAIFAKFCVGK